MIRVLPLAEVTLFLNLGPILTVFVGGCLILRERAKCSDTFKVIVSVVSVLLIIIGKKMAL